MKKPAKEKLELILFPEFHARVRELARKKRKVVKSRRPYRDLITFPESTWTGGEIFSETPNARVQLARPFSGKAGKWPPQPGENKGKK